LAGVLGRVNGAETAPSIFIGRRMLAVSPSWDRTIVSPSVENDALVDLLCSVSRDAKNEMDWMWSSSSAYS